MEILSVRVDPVNLSGAIAKVRQFLNGDRLHQIATVNPEFIMAAQRDADFLRILNRCDLNVADGIGLRVAAVLLGLEIGDRVTGVELSWGLARVAADRGYSIFLLGSGEGVAEAAAARLKSVYPDLRIAGTYAGRPDEPQLVERINRSGADILLVAFGAPRQERFISDNKEKLNVKVAMGVGGTLDYISGTVPWAPAWMRRSGMEWLYRVIKQPVRINRIITATLRFPITVIMFKFFGRQTRQHTSNCDSDGVAS